LSTPDPFLRQRALAGFGPAGQEALASAHVVMVGVGGLGCPAALYLASSGVGRLTLIDDDAVAVSNLHRQILFGPDDVGSPKVEAAARALGRVAPWCEVASVRARVGADGFDASVAAGVDAVVDGTDGWPSRRAVAALASSLDAPLVWGAAVGWFGQAAVFSDASDLELVFPGEADDPLATCEGQGVAAVTTALVGAQMAANAVALLTGAGDPSGRLHSVDARTGRWRETALPVGDHAQR